MLSVRSLWRCTIRAQFSSGIENLLGIPGVSEKLEMLADRQAVLAKQLTVDPSSLADSNKLRKEFAALEPIVDIRAQLIKTQQEAADLRSLAERDSEGAEMQQYAKEELAIAEQKLGRLSRDLLSALVQPRDEPSRDDVILEVRAGVGGEEGALFAFDLYRMYQKYCQLKKWKTEVMEMAQSERGGIKFASLSISGKGILDLLSMEGGVHRVQRVPLTEKSGRLQTSAASVVVLRQPSDIDVVLSHDDLRIDVYRASGAGGQHVNTTESAVRITHLPTKISVAIQDERSQHRNKEKALRVLRAKLYELKRSERAKEQSESRKQSIGTGDRSERIRTYNYAQDRVTDHRIQHSETGVQEMMDGLKLDAFVDLLLVHFQLKRLEKIVEHGHGCTT